MRTRFRSVRAGVRNGMVVGLLGYCLGYTLVTTSEPARSQEVAVAPPALAGSRIAPPVMRSDAPVPVARPADPPVPVEGPAETPAPAAAHWAAVNGSPGGVHPALRVPILMYHRVIDPAFAGRSLPELVVPPRLFLAQMTTLWNAGWRTIDTATLAADLATGTHPAPRSFVISFDDGYPDGFTQAYPILKHLGFVATYYVVTGRIGWSDQLTAEELTQMAAAGMEIGDHTVDHLDLAELSARDLRPEIDDARTAILRTVGEAPVSFAYPFGDLSPRVVAAVASAGFEIAVTNREGVRETWADRYDVPRLRVGPGTSPSGLLRQMARFASGS